MWKPSGSTSRRRASSPSSASAGGQDEQPCEVNSSTTTGRGSAFAGVVATASPRIIPAKRIIWRFVIAFSPHRAPPIYAPSRGKAAALPITLARAGRQRDADNYHHGQRRGGRASFETPATRAPQDDVLSYCHHRLTSS